MTDKLTQIERSHQMRLIKSKNTVPELTVRKLCRELGFSGYRIHRKSIPGSPDISFVGRKKAIFVHGCFWHGHQCKYGNRPPKSNQNYWQSKIEKNMQRDAHNLSTLETAGWAILVVWECELKNRVALSSRIMSFLAQS